MESIGKGDEVLTTGGLIGRVVKVSDNGYIVVALNETTEVTIKRDFCCRCITKRHNEKLFEFDFPKGKRELPC